MIRPPEGHGDDRHGASVHGMMDDGYWSAFSSDFADYELGPVIGFGASAMVYSAVYRPSLPTPPSDQSQASTSVDLSPTAQTKLPPLRIDIPDSNNSSCKSFIQGRAEKDCAIKVSSLYPNVELLFKESRLLSLCRHPNVLRILAAFTLPPDHRRIAFVTPLIHGGSLAGILEWRSRLADTPKHHHASRFHIRRRNEEESGAALPRGVLSEEEVKAVVRQVLEGLVYLHERGYIHRDVKAGNILIEQDGTILLADFGVGGDMNDPLTPVERGRPGVEDMRFHAPAFVPPLDALSPGTGGFEDSGKRKSFVGTPNWMAPEVILGQRYDSKADIWSLGITIMELVNGSAPRAKEKPNKVLKHIAMDPAPQLERSVGGFSKAMKEFVDGCLVKDPAQRPTAAGLLEHAWIKSAKKRSWLAEALLDDVPPIEARQELRRVPSLASMLSQASSWNFDSTPSLPSSPTRTSLHAQLPNLPIRSPSTFSHLHAGANGEYEYFPPASRSQSRTSSRVGSVPPSPRVPLKQWAERTYSTGGLGDDEWSRSRSERGSRRSLRSGSLPLRRGQSVSFDENGREELSPSASGMSGMSAMSGSNGFNLGAPVWRRAEGTRRHPSMDGGTMSPLVESSLSMGSPVKPFVLGGSGATGLDSRDSSALDLTGLRIRTPPCDTPLGLTRRGELGHDRDEGDVDLDKVNGALGAKEGREGGSGMGEEEDGGEGVEMNRGDTARHDTMAGDVTPTKRTSVLSMSKPAGSADGPTGHPTNDSPKHSVHEAATVHTSKLTTSPSTPKPLDSTAIDRQATTKAETNIEQVREKDRGRKGWLHRRIHGSEHGERDKEKEKEKEGGEDAKRSGGLKRRLTGKFGRIAS